MTVISIVFGMFGTVTKELAQVQNDFDVETIQTTVLLRLARILRRDLETCSHSHSSGKPSARYLSFFSHSFGIKLIECEKKDKYLDLARVLKKLWNMQVTIIPIVIGAFGTVTKGLLKGLEDLEVGGRVETIQTTALLRTARILRRVLEN